MLEGKSHWDLQLWIKCPHCNYEYDYLNGRDYCEEDGWEKLPTEVLGSGSFTTNCDVCKKPFKAKIQDGL